MPLVPIEIEETYRSVTRPILLHVLSQLMVTWGFPQNQTRLVMMGETESIPVTHSAMGKHNTHQRLDTDTTIQIEVDETHDTEVSPYQPRLASETAPIFYDPRLELWVTPCYRRMKVEINVTLRWTDRVKAQVWRKSLDARLKAWTNATQFRCDYHVPVPDGMIYLLHQCYLLRESAHGYGETEGHWLKENFNPRYTLLSNQSDTGHTFALRESQAGILGFYPFDQDGLPQVESINNGTAHQVNFTYQLYYMRPEHFQVKYPVSIHGQMLPDQYQMTEQISGYERYLRLYDARSAALSDLSFNQQTTMPWAVQEGIPIPFFDDWNRYRTLKDMRQILRILLSVDTANPRDLLNWEGLGSLTLHPFALRMLKRRPAALSTPFDHVFFINLYQFGKMIGLSHVQTDALLDSRHDEDLNPRHEYHITLDMVVDPSKLSDAARQDLFSDPEFSSVYKDLVKPPVWKDFIDVYGDPTNSPPGSHGVVQPGPWTHQILQAQIITYRPE